MNVRKSVNKVPILVTPLLNKLQKTSRSHKESVIQSLLSDEKTPQIIRPHYQNVGLRRSKRNRVLPLDHWRGQRVVYKRDSTGITYKMVSINKGSHYSKNIGRKGVKKGKKGLKRTVNNVLDENRGVLDLSLHDKHLKQVFKQNDENKRIQQNADSIRFLDDYNWTKSEGSVGVEIAIINKISEKGKAIGMLKLGPMAVKEKSRTEDYATHFTVSHGALGLQIEDNPHVIVKTGFYFHIGKYTNYTLHNSRHENAFLSFTVSRD